VARGAKTPSSGAALAYDPSPLWFFPECLRWQFLLPRIGERPAKEGVLLRPPDLSWRSGPQFFFF